MPQQKKTDRQSKKNQVDQILHFESLNKIIEYLDSVFQFNKKMAAQMRVLKSENIILTEQIQTLQRPRTYSAIAATSTLSATH